METVWMLDYLGAVFPYMGVFVDEEAALKWVFENDWNRKQNYTPFEVTINTDNAVSVPTTAPFRQYINQR